MKGAWATRFTNTDKQLNIWGEADPGNLWLQIYCFIVCVCVCMCRQILDTDIM